MVTDRKWLNDFWLSDSHTPILEILSHLKIELFIRCYQLHGSSCFIQARNKWINQWKNLMINCNLFVISRANVNSCSAVRGKILTRMMNEYINWNQIKRIGFFFTEINQWFFYLYWFFHTLCSSTRQPKKQGTHSPKED